LSCFREISIVEHLRELGNKAAELEGRIRAMHRTDAAGQLLETIPGVGPLTASALAASIGNPRAFRDGRELGAWLGLVPRQHSSGGKPHLLGISKRGDAALRTLLTHGARAVIRMAATNPEMADSWVMKLCRRRHKTSLPWRSRQKMHERRGLCSFANRSIKLAIFHTIWRDGLTAMGFNIATAFTFQRLLEQTSIR
jgi:transposase